MNYFSRVLFLALLSPNLLATTLRVDGPGDGDTSGIDDFDTVAAALATLTSDGVSDEILIFTQRLMEEQRWVINTTDSLLIQGDAGATGLRTDIFISRPPFTSDPWSGVTVLLSSNQRIDFLDLTLVQNHLGSSSFSTALTIRSASPESLIESCGVSLQNVMITATNEGNTAVPPDVEPTVRAIRWGNAVHFAQGLFGPDTALHLSNVTLAHTQENGLALGPAPTAVGGRVIIENSRITDSLNAVRAVNWVSGAFDISRTRIDDFRIALDVLRAFGGAKTTWHIGPGTQFDNGFYYALQMSNGGSGPGGPDELWIEGTRKEPVLFHVTGSYAVHVGNPAATVPHISDVIVCDHDIYGMQFTNFDASDTPPLFDHCLFVNNGSVGNTGHVNLQGWQLQAPRGTVNFTECTFHGGEDTRSDLLLLGAHDMTANFSNCIFSSSSHQNYVFSLAGNPAGQIVNLDQCAVVTEGPHAVRGLRNTNFPIPVTINQTGVITRDPGYPDIQCPPGPNSFDVSNSFYGTTGPGPRPLTGWGDYIGEFADFSGLLTR